MRGKRKRRGKDEKMRKQGGMRRRIQKEDMRKREGTMKMKK